MLTTRRRSAVRLTAVALGLYDGDDCDNPALEGRGLLNLSLHRSCVSLAPLPPADCWRGMGVALRQREVVARASFLIGGSSIGFGGSAPGCSTDPMRELYQAIPDPDALLALEPEELGATVLFIMRARLEREPRGHLHPGNMIGEVGNPRMSDWPPERTPELKLAVAETFAWLKAQGLLIPTTDNNAGAGWMTLSRRARGFESPADLMSYAGARRLPRELHPQLGERLAVICPRRVGRGGIQVDARSRGRRARGGRVRAP